MRDELLAFDSLPLLTTWKHNCFGPHYHSQEISAAQGSPIPFRYDKERNTIYADQKWGRVNYTYIAKAKHADIYKIGQTSDLCQRMAQLRKKKPYSLLELEAFAYCKHNVECLVLSLTGARGRSNPAPFDGCHELIKASNGYINEIMQVFDFTPLAPGEPLPGKINKTVRCHYNATTGEPVCREYFFEPNETLYD